MSITLADLKPPPVITSDKPGAPPNSPDPGRLTAHPALAANLADSYVYGELSRDQLTNLSASIAALSARPRPDTIARLRAWDDLIDAAERRWKFAHTPDDVDLNDMGPDLQDPDAYTDHLDRLVAQCARKLVLA